VPASRNRANSGAVAMRQLAHQSRRVFFFVNKKEAKKTFFI
jgi:hypothetical protein